MDSSKFWYYFGVAVGLIFRVAVIAAVVYGIVTQVWNREIPYIPVILLLVFHAWSKTLMIFDGLRYMINNPQPARVDASEIEKIVRAVNFKNIRFGSPN